VAAAVHEQDFVSVRYVQHLSEERARVRHAALHGPAYVAVRVLDEAHARALEVGELGGELREDARVHARRPRGEVVLPALLPGFGPGVAARVGEVGEGHRRARSFWSDGRVACVRARSGGVRWFEWSARVLRRAGGVRGRNRGFFDGVDAKKVERIENDRAIERSSAREDARRSERSPRRFARSNNLKKELFFNSARFCVIAWCTLL
jgi:hypothetical protein